MIRFNCPNCSRRYELPEALARIPLVCKGCSQPLVVPETSTEPEPRPESPKPVPAPVAPSPPVAPPVPTPAPRLMPEPASRPVVVATENRLPSSDKLSTNGPPAAHPRTDVLFEKPDALAELDALDRRPVAKSPPPAPGRPGGRKLLGAVVDVVVALVLIAIGVFCGELLARQSTSEVLRDAGSAAKFPPVELLMWLSPPLLFLLVYALLVSRGKSVGGFLQRREES